MDLTDPFVLKWLGVMLGLLAIYFAVLFGARL